MTTNITPDKARKLLDRTAPGPWTVEDYGGSRPEIVIETFDGDTLAADVEPEIAQLIAHAPALAQTVAGLHYEYAAQVEKDGRKYIITDSEEGHWLCGDDHKVLQDWHEDYMEAEDYAHTWNKYDGKRDGTTARIVRRLVSPVEVVE